MPAEVRLPRRSDSSDVGPQAAVPKQARRSKRPFSEEGAVGDSGMHIEGTGGGRQLLRKSSSAAPRPDSMLKKNKLMKSSGGDLLPPMTIIVKGGKGGAIDGKALGTASTRTGTTATLSSGSGSGSGRGHAGGRRTKTGITSRSYRQPAPPSASRGGAIVGGENGRTNSGGPQTKKKTNTPVPSASFRRPAPAPVGKGPPPRRAESGGGISGGRPHAKQPPSQRVRRSSATKPRAGTGPENQKKNPPSPGRQTKSHVGAGTAHSSPSCSNRSPSVRNSQCVREIKPESPPPPPALHPEPAQSALDEKFHDSGVEVVTSTSSYGAMPNIQPLQSSREVGVPLATVRYGGQKPELEQQRQQLGSSLMSDVAAKLADFEEQLKDVGERDHSGRSAHRSNTKKKGHRSTSRSSSHSGGNGYGDDRETDQDDMLARRRGKKNGLTSKARSSKDIAAAVAVAAAAAGKGGADVGSKESSSRLSSIRQDLAASATEQQPRPKPSLLRRLSNGPKEMFRRLSNGNLMAGGNDDDIDEQPPDRTNLVVDTSAGGHSPSDDSSDVSTISATAVSADQQALLAKYLLEAGNAANEAEAAQIAAKYASSSNHGGQSRKLSSDDGIMSKFAQFHQDDIQEEDGMWTEMDAKAAIVRDENPGAGSSTAGRAFSGSDSASDWLPKDQVIEDSGYGNFRSSNASSDLAEKGIILAPVSAHGTNERSSSDECVDWKVAYRRDRMENDQDRGQGHRGSGMDDTAHTSAAVDGTDQRQTASQGIDSSFRRPGRRRMRYERAQQPGAVQMRGRAQGQLPVWRLDGLRHQQTLQRQVGCEGAATDPNEHIVEAIAVADEDHLLEGDVVYANAESMPSGIKLFFKDRNARICFAVSLLALIGGIVGLSVWLPSRSQGTAMYVHDGSPTNMPTAAPTTTMAPTVDMSPILNVLGKYSSMDDLRRRGSPQNSAMRWMLYEDTDHSLHQHAENNHHVYSWEEYLDPQTLQRYITAVLYFALHECTNAWESDEDTWLQPYLHACDWARGISCQTYAGNNFIVALDLGKVGACGKIPPEIAHYDKLGSLILDENEIYGTIADEFCQLSSLKVLSMGSNRIEGTFPECVGLEMTSLTTLDLSNNLIQNTFPDSFFKLRNLRVLDLSQNSISGTISNELLPDLKALTIANIASNQFSGKLPMSFDDLPDLAYMHLDNNLFSGLIPSFTAFLGRREAITLSNNLLTGTIPAKIPAQTDLVGGSVNPADFRMAKLDISHNLISGTIPPLVGFIPSLKYVDYSNNDLTGTLPQTLGRFGLMTKIEYISAANNQFEGPIVTLGYPETTRHIDVSNNKNLEGGFPSFLLEYKALEYLDLSNTDFKGQLPQNIGDLKSLLYFGAKDSGLSGAIPSSLGNLGQVTQVDISKNSLSGSIPPALGMMNSLRVFQANSNVLTGSIPSEFSSLKNLESLNLEGNKLIGQVPGGVCDLGLKTMGVDCTVQCGCCDGECNK